MSVRYVYAEVPSRVEYGLSEMGTSLLTVLRELRKWGLKTAARQLPVKCFHCKQCEPFND
ncbi:winged helix-turn-helix transcriptional regulator [Desulfosporosinus sp. PR]|uniref:winged helix-turn-helix transcriptional regulator n=1 Tax=Candidatus Desulfosporosinus nitrosoreducens TaxID=3401928 RepID=UPI0027F7DA1C|nr:winged helix-turn-helix transcriptional regulator [Desulfosporosinus sp. PR]MDQ7094300.1 winged helix-turn-helix transcriptional regulator [Desulfosporosinus sp. PR]